MSPVLLFFDISGGELLIILLVAFLVFGPQKLPELARKVGRGMNEIRRASDEIKREINKEGRKLDQDLNQNSAWGKDFQQTTDEIDKGLSDAAKAPPKPGQPEKNSPAEGS